MVTGRAPVVALDGPASSGKSSVGAAVAAALRLRFFDSGLLYRALAFAALDHGVDPADGPAVAALAPAVSVEPDEEGRLDRVRIDGRDVSARVRTHEVDRVVSAVARAPEVRAALLIRQRGLAEGGGIVVAGRDIGTVVLPAADVKIWLDASAEERAARRALERGIDPASAAGQAILDEMRRRDGADGGRAIAPARPADDAIHVRTDGNTLDQTIAAVVAAVTAGLAAGAAGRTTGAAGRTTGAAVIAGGLTAGPEGDKR
ncbi:MAG TPA: (d)CMP kinase [Candidatus Limnocylindrales bacterium]